MSAFLSVLQTLRTSAHSRAALQLEILPLRHQLQVLQRTRPRRLRLATTDRCVWITVLRSFRLICGGTPSRRARKLGAAPATGRPSAHGQASATEYERSTLLGGARQGVARLADRLDRRTAEHGRALASPMAPSPIGRRPALDTVEMATEQRRSGSGEGHPTQPARRAP
jgi:hypothetical protein